MSLSAVLDDIAACRACAGELPHAPRPVVFVRPQTRLLIAGQAPGRRVHESGLPFNDASGDRRRNWLDVTREEFYTPEKFAIVPMGFCFPGTGRNGDLPPRPECAPTWHPRLLPRLERLRLTLAIGQYAQAGLLDEQRGRTLTETVQAWRQHLQRGVLPLPHPSPRNRLWLARNPWFERDLLPVLRARVADALAG